MDQLQAYRVGGYVRDRLLGLHPHDCDWVVVGASPRTLQSLGFRQVGRDFPVFLHPDTREEYALARIERKIGPGHRGFHTLTSPDVTLYDDLARRDFTINAMALDSDDTLIDPFDGQADLQAGLLRHVGDAFRDDPVRVLRAARFAAQLGFQVAPTTMTLMRDMVADGELGELTAERVWNELWKALSSAHPSRFIRVLHECGALAELFPALAALDGVPQPAQYHPEIDTFIHVLMALDISTQITDDTTTRFAVLVHDLGKGVTDPVLLPSHRGHEDAGVPLVEALCARYRAPRACRELAVRVARDHLHAHRALELRPHTIVRFLERLDSYRRPQRLAQFLDACESDARGRLGLEQRPYRQADYLRACFAASRNLSLKDILEGDPRDEQIGELLRTARIDAVKGVKRAWQAMSADD